MSKYDDLAGSSCPTKNQSYHGYFFGWCCCVNNIVEVWNVVFFLNQTHICSKNEWKYSQSEGEWMRGNCTKATNYASFIFDGIFAYFFERVTKLPEEFENIWRFEIIIGFLYFLERCRSIGNGVLCYVIIEIIHLTVYKSTLCTRYSGF